MEEQTIYTINNQPVRAEISTNAKGQHQWTLSIQGTDLAQILKTLIDADSQLIEKYKDERE
jgi:DNA topoisomerase IB